MKSKLNNTNVALLKERYNLSDAEMDIYTTEIFTMLGNSATLENLEEYLEEKGHRASNLDYLEEEEERLFKTTKNRIIVPTNELIKIKGSDFRVLLGISVITNTENTLKTGANSIYTSIKKVDNNMDQLCKSINISPSQFRKQLRSLLKNNSDEFKLVEKEFNGKNIKCYEINYIEGGFVTIPYSKVEKLIIGLSNNCIKLYSNLLWLCQNEKEFIERELTQEFLLELMGLSATTKRVMRIAVETLEECKLIKTRTVWESETILNSEGLPIGSKPKTKIYYSIVM